MEYCETDPLLRESLDLIRSRHFSNGDAELVSPIVDSLLHRDEYMLLAYYHSYLKAQHRAGAAYQDRNDRAGESILTVARMGIFSSVRSAREYCSRIRKIEPAG